MEPLLAPSFLFRFQTRCLYSPVNWTPGGISLGPDYQLPYFGALDERLERMRVRVAWNEKGLYFTFDVGGKRQPPWCRDTRIEDSDGVQLLIDTRATHNVHRASRFCHRFAVMPSGTGRGLDEPFIGMLAINRARESPREVDERALKVAVRRQPDGYQLDAYIPSTALTGFDPADHPRLGFTYLILDRELGTQAWTISPTFPILEDPSLWGTLELAPV